MAVTIIVKNNLETALKKFKKKVEKTKILIEYKERQHYIKPSEKRKLKINANKKNHKHTS